MDTNEIMDALKGVQMTAKNKSKLANSIMKASSGQNVVVKEPLMKYYYYKNGNFENTTLYTTLCNINADRNGIMPFSVTIKASIWSGTDNDNMVLLSDGFLNQSGYDEPVAICVHGLVTPFGRPIDLAEAIVMLMIIANNGGNPFVEIDTNNPEYISTTAVVRIMLQPLEITEEEFFEGINTSL